MKIGWRNSEESGRIGTLIETKVSFRPFIAFLEQSIASGKTIKKGVFEFVLEHFHQPKAMESPIDTDHIENYEHLLELVYSTLSPVIADEETFIWAMSCPASKNIFYSTEAFDSFIATAKHIGEAATPGEDETTFLRQKYLNHIYRLILKKYYNIGAVYTERIIYTSTNPETGLDRYFRIIPDTRFVDVIAKNDLPQLNHKLIDSCMHSSDITSVLTQMLPISSFYLEGFTVLQMEDVTYDYALDIIKKILLQHPTDQPSVYNEVKKALKLLAGDKDAEFGLLPFLKVNNRLVLDDIECSRSVLIKAVSNCGEDMTAVNEMAERFLKNPGKMIFRTISEELSQSDPHLAALKDTGVTSYAVLPVYYNQEVVGVIEVYSYGHTLNYEQILTRLRDAVSLVAQLLQNSIEQFEQRLDNVIKRKFTPLQPAVQWKFNDVALEYLRGREDDEKVTIGSVKFENVSPLFGAIDIRNSTVERNRALADDITQLHLLLDFYEETVAVQLSEEDGNAFKKRVANWREKIGRFLRSGDSGMLNTFLQTEVAPFLERLAAKLPSAADQLNELKNILEHDGKEISGNRDALEESIQLVNNTLNNYFEAEGKEIQEIYPCYFETFRTDGIEYDLYAGQSIDPEKPFTHQHLEAFRLWQLRSMCAITRITNGLLGHMPRQLQTTQLIYVNAHPINISFRNDERHFDVDGSYNIRYQIIKKRIDKVHIKDTHERLTQPGKVAIVYFNDTDATEYRHYIDQCRQQGLLTDEEEWLELEELQGVTGLRAIRLGVNTSGHLISSDPEFSEWHPDASLT